MNYKAIVFDYGGVLMLSTMGKRSNMLVEIAALIDVEHETLKAEYFKHNHMSNVENRPWVDGVLAAVTVFNDLPEIAKKVRTTVAEFNAKVTQNTELLETLPRLTEAGYEIAILSNYTAELREIIAENGIDQYFEHVFVSGEIGYQKPDPRIFQAVCDGLEIEPSEMVFIDDTPKSLETAAEVGYTPILFENNE